LPDEGSTTQGMSDFDAVFSQATDGFLELSFSPFSQRLRRHAWVRFFRNPKCRAQDRFGRPQNALVEYAAKNSTMAKSSDASSEAEKSKQQPSYVLGEKIVTTSTSKDKRTLKCSSSISATVGDTKASKEVNFTVQQSDGKITVSVDPFQF
jgi:hypothetical protein